MGGALFFSLYCMWRGNYDTSTWYTPYEMIVPFDTTTVFGWYFLVFGIQIHECYMYVFIAGASVSYFVSFCYYIEACCEQFNAIMFDMNDELTKKNNADVIVAKEIFNEAIRLHFKVIQ